MPPDILGLLEDIHEAIGFIAEDTAGISFETFMDDRRTRQTVGWNVAVIGEAVNRLRRRAPDVAERISASRQIVDFRNAILHGYDVIDYPTVWQIIQKSLPVLNSEIEQLLREADEDTP